MDCEETGDNSDKTSAEITYTFFPLNEEGLKLNKHRLHLMYAKDLKDWEEAINDYLEIQY